MDFVPALNTAQVEFRYTVGEQQTENVLYCRSDASMSTARLTSLGGVLHSWWVAHIQNLQLTNTTLRQIYLTDLTTQTGPTFTYTAALPATGNNSGAAAPNNVSLAVSFRTDGRGRSSRGRNFIQAVAKANAVDNQIDSAVADAYVTAYAALPTFLTADDWTHVIVSRVTNGANRPTALIQPVSAYLIVDRIVDSMRRRLPGRGR